MQVTTHRVKQYNSTYKSVVCVDSKPFCITQSKRRAELIKAYLSGYEVEIKDESIKKMCDKEILKGGGVDE